MSEKRIPSGVDPGSGIGEWEFVLRSRGITDVANGLKGRLGGSKADILKQIESAGLPIEPHLQLEVEDFLKDPGNFFGKLPEFETYFVVFKPGVERAVGVTRDQVVKYVREIHESNPEYTSFYLSGHDYVFSGGILVDEIGRATGTFVLGQYNELSSGRRSPDLRVTMNPLSQPEYEFAGNMGSNNDWTNDPTLYSADNGHQMTKPEMADMAKRSMFMLPRDGSTLSEGWYELKVLEYPDESGEINRHPYFIKAIY